MTDETEQYHQRLGGQSKGEEDSTQDFKMAEVVVGNYKHLCNVPIKGTVTFDTQHAC